MTHCTLMCVEANCLINESAGKCVTLVRVSLVTLKDFSSVEPYWISFWSEGHLMNTQCAAEPDEAHLNAELLSQECIDLVCVCVQNNGAHCKATCLRRVLLLFFTSPCSPSEESAMML